MTGNRILTNTAFVTSVALDEYGKPSAVPPLLFVTKEEKKRFAEGKQRMLHRKRERKKEQ
jgi:acyl-CoA hydrolase